MLTFVYFDLTVLMLSKYSEHVLQVCPACGRAPLLPQGFYELCPYLKQRSKDRQVTCCTDSNLHFEVKLEKTAVFVHQVLQPKKLSSETQFFNPLIQPLVMFHTTAPPAPD